MNLVLSNARHPEYGVMTAPFPIPAEEYDRIIEMLAALEIGDAIRRDCRVDQVSDEYPILKRLERNAVNIDEMDYLAKRLDSFCDQEVAQFQTMAVQLGIFDMTDFINLTFCCQQATVITDFSDLDEVGRRHFLTMNGGGAPLEDVNKINGRELAKALINYEQGEITPYGVVYDNGMMLERLYDGQTFPDYDYGDTVLTVTMTGRDHPDTETYIHLPVPERKLDRILQRAGIKDPREARLEFAYSILPDPVDCAFRVEEETLQSLNAMAKAVSKIAIKDLNALRAAAMIARPENARQTEILAKHLEAFEYVPNIKTPGEYGKYMIQQSGHFEYDPELEDYYQYEAYGQRRIQEESGQFNELGYVSYHGMVSMQELLLEEPRQDGIQMKGL